MPERAAAAFEKQVVGDTTERAVAADDDRRPRRIRACQTGQVKDVGAPEKRFDCVAMLGQTRFQPTRQFRTAAAAGNGVGENENTSLGHSMF